MQSLALRQPTCSCWWAATRSASRAALCCLASCSASCRSSSSGCREPPEAPVERLNRGFTSRIMPCVRGVASICGTPRSDLRAQLGQHLQHNKVTTDQANGCEYVIHGQLRAGEAFELQGAPRSACGAAEQGFTSRIMPCMRGVASSRSVTGVSAQRCSVSLWTSLTHTQCTCIYACMLA